MFVCSSICQHASSKSRTAAHWYVVKFWYLKSLWNICDAFAVLFNDHLSRRPAHTSVCTYPHILLCGHTYINFCVHIPTYTSVCVYLHILLCAYTYIYLCAHIYIYFCVHIHTFTSVCISLHILLCAYTCIYFCVHIPTYTSVCIYLHTLQCACTYIYFCVHAIRNIVRAKSVSNKIRREDYNTNFTSVNLSTSFTGFEINENDTAYFSISVYFAEQATVLCWPYLSWRMKNKIYLDRNILRNSSFLYIVWNELVLFL